MDEPRIQTEAMMSPTISELAKSLCKAQAAMGAATKDSDNPFFKSKYADLTAVWNAAKKPLTDYGLCVVQQLGAEGESVTMTTMLIHTSGEWIKSVAKAAPVKKDPQAIGSCATYLRRYGLSALVGICTEDDDGNAASQSGAMANSHWSKPITTKRNAAFKHDTDEMSEHMQSILSEGKK